MRSTVTPEQAGQRLDSYLHAISPDYSRSFWQQRCNISVITVNGEATKASRKLHENDEVEYSLPKTPDHSQESLPIIYEDTDVIVLNKPAGVLTHAKGVLNEEFSVAEFLRPRTTDGLETNRPGIVHRLDRATSGVIIAAKNPKAKRWLQKQFSLRKVKKNYIALVTGHPEEPAARINLPIERNPKQPQTFRVGASGKQAETTYETLRIYQDYTLLKLKPLTGRTHQLRVHLGYVRCPIVGDPVYGREAPALKRMFLHAAELEITLPSRERKIFTAPLPPELESFLNSLQ